MEGIHGGNGRPLLPAAATKKRSEPAYALASAFLSVMELHPAPKLMFNMVAPLFVA